MGASSLRIAAEAFLGAFGGDVPKWLQPEAEELANAIEAETTAAQTRRWMPVRRDSYDGHEWVSVSEQGPDEATVRQIAVQHDRDMPTGWSVANPIVRVVEFTITEAA
jgi:hypothetical protein